MLDQESGLSGLNKLASGSGSSPAPGASYDTITRGTGLAAIEAMRSQSHRRRQGGGNEPGSTGTTSAATSTGPSTRLPFVFVSAAEAGWTFRSPLPFLERYLEAKRAVEAELLGKQGGIPSSTGTQSGSRSGSGSGPSSTSLSEGADGGSPPLLRGTILRPSLIWTWERPQALLSVLPFYIANALGVPFVDR